METEQNVFPLTWSWVGGFIQAEGSIGVRRVTISQAQGNALELIADFLKSQIPTLSDLKVSKPYRSGLRKDGSEVLVRQLAVFSSGHVEVMQALYPHLRYDKSERIARCLKMSEPSMPQPFNDDWIVGFWEGDGWLEASTSYIFGFGQSNTALLQDVQAYLGLGGSIRGTQLVIPVTKTRVQRIGELLQRVRSSHRREQLDRLLRR